MVAKARTTGYTYQDLVSNIKSGNLASVYLFLGDEDFLIAQGIEALVKALLPGEEGSWNLAEFESKETSPDEVVTFLCTLPVFGARRVAVVRDFHRWTAAETENLMPLLEAMPDYAHLILVADTIDKRTKCYRTINSHGKVVECTRLDASSAIAWVTRRGAELGLKLGPKIARQLVDRVGLSLWRLDSELSKLATYKDESHPQVTEEEIDKLAITGQEVADNAIFRFTDAVAEGNQRLSVELLEELLASGREPLSILAMIARQLRIIAFALEASRVGMRQPDVAKELGVPGFAVQRAMIQGEKLGPSGVRGALIATFQADGEIKSGLHPPDRALELLVARLTTVLPH